MLNIFKVLKLNGHCGVRQHDLFFDFLVLGFFGLSGLFCWRLLNSPLLHLQQSFVQEVEFFFVNYVRLWQHGIVLELRVFRESVSKFAVAFYVEFLELLETQFQGVAKLYCYFLLFLENKFVVLHVFLGVRFEVAAQLMQIQTVFVRALLTVEKELTKLGGPEAGSDQAIVVNKLVDRQNCICTFSRTGKSHVRGITWAASATVVDIICVDHNLFNLSVLSKEINASQSLLAGDVWGKTDNIHQCFLDNSQVPEFFYFIFAKGVDRNFHLSIFRRCKAK